MEKLLIAFFKTETMVRCILLTVTTRDKSQQTNLYFQNHQKLIQLFTISLWKTELRFNRKFHNFHLFNVSFYE